MFGRTKEAQPPDPSPAAHPEKVGGKNRPTPRRSTAEAANRRPLVAKDRRAAGTASKAMTREERRAAQAGRLAGDDRYLPVRDQGPVRAYVRDLVDSRRNAGDYFMPAVIVMVILSYVVNGITRDPTVLTAVTSLLYVLILLVVLDAVLLRRKVRRAVSQRYGEENVTGVASYAIMRSIQMRRLRIPRTMRRHGEQPR